MATIPGVTTDASNARSWSDTPDAVSIVPAAVKTAPNANNTKYIRLSPAPLSHPAPPASIVAARSAPCKGYSPKGGAETGQCSDMVNATGVAQPPMKVLFRGTFRFPARLPPTPRRFGFYIEE